MSVLLLNASFQPLHVVTTRRALCLILSDKAELIHSTDDVVWTAGGHRLEVPTVARLLYMVRVPFTRELTVRRAHVEARDQGECQVAGCRDRGTTLDHMIPRSRGGDHSWENVVLMCSRHNGVKGNRLLEELGWQLKQRPIMPPRAAAIRLRVQAGSRADDPTWSKYLAFV